VAVLVSNEKYSKLTKKRPELAAALDQFRGDFDLVELNIAEVYQDVRERNPGRDEIVSLRCSVLDGPVDPG